MTFQNLTVSTHYARAIIETAAIRGYAPAPLLRTAGIHEGMLSSEETRITPEQLARLVQAAWVTEDDEFLGMGAARCRHGVFTLMAKQAVFCKNLRGVYRHICRFYNLTTTALELEFATDETEASIRMRLADPSRDKDHMLAEFLMLLWHRFPAWLIGKRIPLSRIGFEFDKPGHVEEYRLLFPCPVDFNQPTTQFSFPSKLLSSPVVQTPETLKTHLRRAPLDWFSRQTYYPAHTRKVLDALTGDDGFVDLQIEQIAQSLNMTSRTLRRKLSDENTSFQEIKNLSRRDIAIHLLSRRDLSIAAIAHKLGYSEVASFSRAFKQWTGLEPSRYRT